MKLYAGVYSKSYTFDESYLKYQLIYATLEGNLTYTKDTNSKHSKQGL